MANKGCHDCKKHLEGEKNPYFRCLEFFKDPAAVEALQSGLIGECGLYEERQPRIEYE